MNDIAVIHLGRKWSKKPSFCVVSPEDFEELNQYNWCLHSGGYVIRRDKSTGKLLYMHRQIMDAEPDDYVDHRNRAKTDNRRGNLRFCTMSQNIANQGRAKPPMYSRFKGVEPVLGSNGRRWIARIRKLYKTMHIGYYDSQIEAAEAYNKKAVELFGEFASLNTIGGT